MFCLNFLSISFNLLVISFFLFFFNCLLLFLLFFFLSDLKIYSFISWIYLPSSNTFYFLLFLFLLIFFKRFLLNVITFNDNFFNLLFSLLTTFLIFLPFASTLVIFLLIFFNYFFFHPQFIFQFLSDNSTYPFFLISLPDLHSSFLYLFPLCFLQKERRKKRFSVHFFNISNIFLFFSSLQLLFHLHRILHLLTYHYNAFRICTGYISIFFHASFYNVFSFHLWSKVRCRYSLTGNWCFVLIIASSMNIYIDYHWAYDVCRHLFIDSSHSQNRHWLVCIAYIYLHKIFREVVPSNADLSS